MMNFGRRDRIGEVKQADKGALKPALYDPPVNPNRTPQASAASRPPMSPSPPQYPLNPPPSSPPVRAPEPPSPPAPQAAEPQRSRLHVGLNIQLKGVEISQCDVLVIEGNVEATVHSKAMEIAKPGTLKGTAFIDVAEIHGDFSGELTARTRLVVHGTGHVSGTIRYGKLVVEEGGEVSGDVKRVDEAHENAPPPRASASTPASTPSSPAHRPTSHGAAPSH